MEIVQLTDERQASDGVVQLNTIYVIGGCLHQMTHAVLEDGHSCEHYEDGEEKGADGVSYGPSRLTVDN